MAADSLFTHMRARETERRELCPQAYALTANETMRVKRIDFAIFLFFDAHREFVGVSREAEGDRPAAYHNIYNDESIALLQSTFKSKRISLSNAAKIAERVLNGRWFTLDSVVYRDDDGEQRYYLSTDGERKGVISRDEWPEVYRVLDEQRDNAEALRDALSLEAGYLYIDSSDLQTLRVIKHISEYASQPFTAPTQAGYIAYKSTREATALMTVGNSALKAARYDDANERYDLITSTGVKIYLRGKLISKRAFVSMDKLLRQLMNKAYDSGFKSREVALTLDEFMRLRRLTDRKEARKQFSQVAIDLSNTVIEVRENYKGEKGKSRLPILGKQWEPDDDSKSPIVNSSIVFMFNADFFEPLRASQSIGYLPEGLLAIDGKSDNAYTIGVCVWDDIRRNLGKGKREGRLKVLTLLKATSLPAAEDINPKYYKRQIMEPFLAALSKAASAEYGNFTYTIYNADGVTEADLFEIRFNYALFSSCVIEARLNNEPEAYTQLRQRNHDKREAKALAAAAKVERDRDKVQAAAKRKASGKSKG